MVLVAKHDEYDILLLLELLSVILGDVIKWFGLIVGVVAVDIVVILGENLLKRFSLGDGNGDTVSSKLID